MKNLVVGVFALGLGLAACSDSDGGGTGGGGGIQEPETTSGSTGGGDATSSGGGDGCGIGDDGTALCAALETCEPGKGEECAVQLAEERCADTACLTAYDDWVACWRDLADADQIPECADYPAECDDERTAYDECVSPDECGPGPSAPVVCDAVSGCSEEDEETCLANQESERCGYPAGSECRTKFDAYQGCIADLLLAGLWEECPDLPEACRVEWDDYAAGCI